MNITEIRSVRDSYLAILATTGLCAAIHLYYTGESITQLVAVALLFGVLYTWSKTFGNFEDFQLKKEKWLLNIVIGAAVVVPMFLGYAILRGMSLSGIMLNTKILIAVLVVATTEEFFFRGYLQGKLRKDFRIVSRIVIVTFFFGLYKIALFSSTKTPLSLTEIVIIACAGSAVVSILLEVMHNLLAPIVSHILWDILILSNTNTVPSWIMTTPQWTETLYNYIFRFCGFFCSQWNLSSYFVAGHQFVTCSGCTGIFLGVFFAFFLFDRKWFARLHTKKFYIPGLLPQICMFVGLNIADFLGLMDSSALSGVSLQLVNYSYTIFGILLGFAGSVLMINTVIMQSEKWGEAVETWLKRYEYVMIPALLLAFLSDPFSNPQMTALIFFSILVVIGIITAVAFLVVLIVSGIKE